MLCYCAAVWIQHRGELQHLVGQWSTCDWCNTWTESLCFLFLFFLLERGWVSRVIWPVFMEQAYRGLCLALMACCPSLYIKLTPPPKKKKTFSKGEWLVGGVGQRFHHSPFLWSMCTPDPCAHTLLLLCQTCNPFPEVLHRNTCAGFWTDFTISKAHCHI